MCLTLSPSELYMPYLIISAMLPAMYGHHYSCPLDHTKFFSKSSMLVSTQVM